MKIAVTGKGGVGKTSFAATLARLYAFEGANVLAADVDPDANLGLALGFSEEEIASITPISKMRDLIAERTASSNETYGKFFKINPRVDDIPDRFAKTHAGVKLLIMGTVETGGSGCVCPEHVMLKRVISHLIIREDDVVIMDMEAGLEHLGRGTAGCMDRFIVVVEPGSRSIQTYERVKELAKDLGIEQVSVVANKVKSAEDEAYVRSKIPAEDLLGILHYSDETIEADRRGVSPFDCSPRFVEEVKQIKNRLDGESATV